jgi:hypothetical protein
MLKSDNKLNSGGGGKSRRLIMMKMILTLWDRRTTAMWGVLFLLSFLVYFLGKAAPFALEGFFEALLAQVAAVSWQHWAVWAVGLSLVWAWWDRQAITQAFVFRHWANIRGILPVVILVCGLMGSIIIAIFFANSQTETFGKIGGFLAVLAFIPYIYSIVYGETKPSRTTWFIWSFIGVLVEVSYLAGGANDSNWVPLVYIFMPLTIALLSIKYGVGGSDRFDYWCIVIAVGGIFLWWMLQLSSIALVFFLIADFVATLPTIVKSYYNPEEEDSFSWLITFSASVINIFAIDMWTFSVAIYPIYSAIIYGIIVFFLALKMNKFKQPVFR